jgi:hypothetical protein
MGDQERDENIGALHSFERNRYFYGKLLTVRDFEVEQSYFRGKNALINRLIHGGGIVCGLEVTVSDDGKTVYISPGVAIDCCGREIVVYNSVSIGIDDFQSDGANYLYLKYAQCYKESVPCIADVSTCEEKCDYNRVMEIFEVAVSSNEPPEIEEFDVDVRGEDPAQEYYEKYLKNCLECNDPEDTRIFLAALIKDSEGKITKYEQGTRDHRVIVPSNPMLYRLLSLHISDTGSHSQVVALKSIEGVGGDENGNVNLENDNSITISTDLAPYTVTIGEKHSARTDNPHKVTAEQAEALSDKGGEITGPLSITGGTDASLGSGGFLVAGEIDGKNIVMDNNEIMAREKKQPSILHLQTEGGDLKIHHQPDEKVFIVKDDGNVGIGTSDPKGKLVIARPDYYTKLDGNQIIFERSTRENKNSYIEKRDTGKLQFLMGEDRTLGLVIQRDGNVGIGREAPEARLDISNNRLLFSVGGEHESDLDDRIISEDLRREFEDNNISLSDKASVSEKTDAEWVITDESKTYTVRKQGDKLDIYMAGNLWFRIGDGGDSGRVWIEYSGNAPHLVLSDLDDPPGIRFQETGAKTEEDPEFKACIRQIHEQNGIGVDGNLTVNGNMTIGQSSPLSGSNIRRLNVSGEIKSFGDSGLRMEDRSDPNNALKEWVVYPYKDYLRFWSRQGGDLVAINYSSGAVGIGTTLPGTRLHVNGDLRVDGKFYTDGIEHGPDCLTSGNNKYKLVMQDDRNLVLYDPEEGPIWATGTTKPESRSMRTGNDYAGYFESLDGKEIPVGTSVVLVGDKISPAKESKVPIGIISANPVIVGGVPVEWPRKYLKDEFGRLIMEEYQEEVMIPKKEKVEKERQKARKRTVEEEVTRTEVVRKGNRYCQVEVTETVTREVEEPVFREVNLYDASGKNVIGKHRVPVMETYEEEIDVLDEDGQPVFVGSGEFVTKQRPKLNPEYDESREYIPRQDRPEWNCVGLLGKIPLRKGQPVADSWIKLKDISEDVELWLVR